MKHQFFKLITYSFLLVMAMSCTQKTNDNNTENSTQFEIEKDPVSEESNVNQESKGCKDQFDYKNDDLVYVGCCTCEYWEGKLDEYLNRNNDQISEDQKLQNISSDLSLEPYVKKIYGYSTLEEAKKAYVNAGSGETGLFRFGKPKMKK